MEINYDVEVIFDFFEKKELFQGYRPAHLIKEDYLTTGVHFYNDINNIDKHNVSGKIAFMTPEMYPGCLWKGKEIKMFVGSNQIGVAKIVKILNPILSASKPMIH